MAQILDFAPAYERARARRRIEMTRTLASAWDTAIATAEPFAWFDALPSAASEREIHRVVGSMLVRVVDGHDFAELDFGSSDITVSWAADVA
jgi:hypothetical protein